MKMKILNENSSEMEWNDIHMHMQQLKKWNLPNFNAIYHWVGYTYWHCYHHSSSIRLWAFHWHCNHRATHQSAKNRKQKNAITNSILDNNIIIRPAAWHRLNWLHCQTICPISTHCHPHFEPIAGQPASQLTNSRAIIFVLFLFFSINKRSTTATTTTRITIFVQQLQLQRNLRIERNMSKWSNKKRTQKIKYKNAKHNDNRIFNLIFYFLHTHSCTLYYVYIFTNLGQVFLFFFFLSNSSLWWQRRNIRKRRRRRRWRQNNKSRIRRFYVTGDLMLYRRNSFHIQIYWMQTTLCNDNNNNKKTQHYAYEEDEHACWMKCRRKRWR